MADRRAEIVAANESQVRAFNQRLELAVGDGPVSIACECGQAGCRVALNLSDEEYRELRAHPDRFAVAPGHEQPEVEDVIHRGDGYLVVEKPAEVAHIVDPEAAGGAGDESVEQLEARLTYVFTSTDELEFAEEGEMGRRLPVAHQLVIPLARHQGRPVRVTLRGGVVVDWAPVER